VLTEGVGAAAEDDAATGLDEIAEDSDDDPDGRELEENELPNRVDEETAVPLGTFVAELKLVNTALAETETEEKVIDEID